MTTLFQVEKVQYVWDEETHEMSPLCKLYFCKHCVELRSLKNLQHEVDSHFCPQSSDGLPSTEAFLKKNKSANCSQCPVCFHVLSVRATTRSKTDDKSPTEPQKKCYYLACPFCRWTSREVGLQDRTVMSGEWKKKDEVLEEKLQNLMTYYKHLDFKIKQEYEQKKMEKRRNFSLNIKQKYTDLKISKIYKPHPASPYAGSLSALQAQFGDAQKDLKKLDPPKTFSKDEVETITDDFYGKIDLSKITTLQQRLDQPSDQTVNVNELTPQQIPMLIKRSYRCKKCDHNLIKPDYNPSSIKFKIALAALYYIPEVRVSIPCDLFAGQKARPVLVVNNPTDNTKLITFQPKEPDSKANCTIEMPEIELKVYSIDEADNFHAAEESELNKEPTSALIKKVKGNRIYFYTECVPNENLQPGDDVWVCFALKHDYVSRMPIILATTPQPEQQAPVPLTHTIYVNIGKIKTNA